jgi:hypothetical protein
MRLDPNGIQVESFETAEPIGDIAAPAPAPVKETIYYPCPLPDTYFAPCTNQLTCVGCA